jgi:hypothetical protein
MVPKDLMINWIASFFATALSNVVASKNEGRSLLGSAIRSISHAPLKAVGAFIFAPFLVFRVVRIASDKRRRWVAAIGLFVAAILAIGAGTLLGSLAGAILMNTLFGPWVAIGFFLGTALSVFFTVIFQILILNATCFLFLGLSSEEVVNYLLRVSE